VKRPAGRPFFAETGGFLEAEGLFDAGRFATILLVLLSLLT